jgi:glucan phosphoethanolaminetransferase (alkaline phosphatase superfamily)
MPGFLRPSVLDSARRYRWLLSLLYVAPILVVAIWALRQYSLRSIDALLVTAALIAMLMAAITRSWRWFFLAQLPFFLLSVAFMAYTLLFGMPPAHTLAMIVVNTSADEIAGFLQVGPAKWWLALWVALAAVYVWLACKVPPQSIFNLKSPRLRYSAVAVLLLASAYLAVGAGDVIDGVALNPTAGSLIFMGGWLPKVSAEMHGARVQKTPYHARRVGGEEVHILIVGESERRASWSAYGYRRVTTPYVGRLGGEAILLRNATTDANLTDWAVPIILTGTPPEQYSLANVRGNIVDLANEAGYSTAWLDNQDIGIVTAIGMTARHTVNPTDFHADINGRHTFDEVLLPAYQRELDRVGTARFIGIHMMGAHWEYFRRYPPSFQRFGSAKGLSVLSIFYGDKRSFSEDVDAYDNAVLYSDWFLGQVIDAARRLKVPATVLFLSDHGEDLQLLDGAAGHGQPVYTEHAFNIPAFVWVNDAYRAAHPQRVKAMEQNAVKEFRSHNVFETEGDLMGITWPGRHPERSLASAQFVPDTSMKRIAGGVIVANP